MQQRKTICLTMIVKNEAHIIGETLEHLCKFIRFDYWAISDTGSTDTTKEIIKGFFKAKGIPGKLQEEEWRDFGYNRTKAFELAFGKTDYAFVWDADDEIYGDFKFPEVLEADSYRFTFGNSSGMRYSRPQLFNNKKRWCYKGVLHEYANCLEACGKAESIIGNYYFVSGRKGARNKDPLKYLKDAQILEAAAEKALAEGDELYNRYIFYCAQSYNSSNMPEKAIEFYKKALTLPLWTQEKYVACLEIYDLCEGLKKPMEGLVYLVESYKYDKERIECFYRLIKYYCINGPVEVAYSYYTVIQDFFENRYNYSSLGDKLFAKKSEYDFYLPYYMVIVADRTKNHAVAAKMYGMIFRNCFIASEWWVRNLINNMRFCMHEFPLDADFLESMLSYVDMVIQKGIKLERKHCEAIEKVIDRYRDILSMATPHHKKLKAGPSSKGVKVMLTITTCKRLDLFTKTMNSILNCWTDIENIDYFFCVDDNSSEEDRALMRESYSFFDYYMKGPEERGHRESMNIIWDKLQEVRPTYWIHLEDDWLYFKREAYVTRAIETLTKYESQNIHQVVFNRIYGLMFTDMERAGGIPLDSRTILHEKRDGIVGRNCGFWPHYSLQPSMIRTRVILELGNYNSPNKFFERDYANKYFAKGYLTAFFNYIYSIHIGKQHWEKEGKNAYALNDITQGLKKLGDDVTSAQEEEKCDKVSMESPFPHAGSMREHLDWFMERISSRIPFALIRPSDGERMVMLGKTLTNCDRWTFQEGGSLQKLLLESVKIQDPNIFIGIPCNTCNKPWNCTQVIYRDFIDKFQIPLAQRTYANIFGNSNWAPFTEFLKSYKKGFYLVSSGTQETEVMRVKGRHVISDKLVNTWDTDGSAETEKVLQFIEKLHGELVLFSAGPLSKVWVPKCFKANPTNMYVDVGAAIDTFTKGNTTRLYTNQAHPFAKESCRFEDVVHKKHMVYMCVFHNKDYLDLLRILLATIKFYTNMNNIDILVFTSSDFVPLIEKLSSLLDLPINTKTYDFPSLHLAGCARLFIFDYEGIEKYEKVLYLDTDIIVQGDLATLFAQDIEDRVYAMKEGTIEHEYHGGWFFDFSVIDKNIAGMNSGILLFKPSQAIRTIFTQINEHIQSMKESDKKLPACLDQPFLNYHLVKNDRHQTGFLETYGLIYCYDPPPPPSSPTDVIICHFVWPVGNARHKKDRMVKHVTHILDNYLAIKGVDYSTNGPDLSHNIYNWNPPDSGTIQLKSDGLLETTWGSGTYKWLDAKTAEASWKIYNHILRFTDDYKIFYSVRKGDIDCVKGVLADKSAVDNMTEEDLQLFFKECIAGKIMTTIPKGNIGKLLKSYVNTVVRKTVEPRLFARKQFRWYSGRIVFEVCDNSIINTWSRTGKYEILDTHILKASWSWFEHIVIFKHDYSRFTSIRISDGNLGTEHTIDTSILDTIPEPSLPLPISLTGSKNLLYFCVFHNKGYLELLDILLTTMLTASRLDGIDLLVVTSKEFEPLVNEMAGRFGIDISVYICDFNTQHEAGCARLFVFDYPKVDDYAKILYMDTDIVVQGDISNLFDLPIEEKVYVKKEYAVGGEGHGGWFFDFSNLDEKTDAMNSGVLLFRNSGKIRAVFSDIRKHIEAVRKSSALLPLCMDQSFIVYHLFRNNLFDNKLIDSYIYLAEFTEPPVSDHLLLSHFVWPIGNTGHKKARMLKHQRKCFP